MKQLLKATLVLLSLACLTAPADAARKGGGGGPSGGCATADLGLSTYTATAGTTSVGIYGPITNCSSGKARYTFTDSFVSACGVATVVHVGSVSFSRGGESILVSTGYSVPWGTCPGTATITRTVSSGATLANVSKQLTVR